MVNNEAAVALTWSGSAADMMSENEELIMQYHKKVQICGLITLSFRKQQKILKVHMPSLTLCWILKCSAKC